MDFMWSLIYCALKSEYFKAAVLEVCETREDEVQSGEG